MIKYTRKNYLKNCTLFSSSPPSSLIQNIFAMFRNNLSICISSDNKRSLVSIILNRLCNTSFPNSSATTSSPSNFPSSKGTLAAQTALKSTNGQIIWNIILQAYQLVIIYSLTKFVDRLTMSLSIDLRLYFDPTF